MTESLIRVSPGRMKSNWIPNPTISSRTSEWFLEFTRRQASVKLGEMFFAFKWLSKVRHDSGLQKFTSLLFFGGLIHRSMKTIQRLILILVDFKSVPMWIAGDIISVHTEIEIDIQMHTYVWGYWKRILWHFRLYGSNHFLVSEFLYCKLGLDGYLSGSQLWPCSSVPYTICDRANAWCHTLDKCIHPWRCHSVGHWEETFLLLWIQPSYEDSQQHVKREGNWKFSFFLHTSRHFWLKTRDHWSSPLMSVGKLGWGIHRKGRIWRDGKQYIYIVPLPARLTEIFQLQKFILN